ncbi:MAG: hypothetical protein EON86_00385 [Brevundimonas sp.]|nr:MAG: hypothetical protein EON86_00385 [Brevundimonas sp.]
MTAASLEHSPQAPAGPRPDRTRFVVETADEAIAVFRDRAWGVTAVLPYLQKLQAETGEDLSLLTDAARASLIYQTDADHLMTRRALAAFLSPVGVERWTPIIDSHIRSVLDRLAAHPAPDLVRDFSDPLFVACMRDVFGLAIPDEAAFLRHIYQARVFTEPLLRLRDLLAVQDGYRHLIAAAAGPVAASADPDAPPPLIRALAAGPCR